MDAKSPPQEPHANLMVLAQVSEKNHNHSMFSDADRDADCEMYGGFIEPTGTQSNMTAPFNPTATQGNHTFHHSGLSADRQFF